MIGDRDERLQGDYRRQRQLRGERARTYLGRALRVSFPHPGSLVVTGTPVCFADVVLTAAHVYVNVGDGTARPKGLLASVPDLDRPGRFRTTLAVKDYRLSTLGRRYDPRKVPEVRDDFLVLQTTRPVPPDLTPLSLLPFQALDPPPTCPLPTLNAAYHADLGLADDLAEDEIVVPVDRIVAGLRVRGAGAVPLLTESSGFSPKQADGARFGRWYDDPFVVFPQHDTHELASGSALVCPERDYLLGVMVGQLFMSADRRSAINVATVNLQGIYRAIAALKGVQVESLHEHCEAG